jgi:hypothetical protein
MEVGRKGPLTYFEQMSRCEVNRNRPLFSKLLTPGGKVMRASEADGKSPAQIALLAFKVDRLRLAPELIPVPDRNVAISVRPLALDYGRDFLMLEGDPIPQCKPEEAQGILMRFSEEKADFFCQWLSLSMGEPFRLPTEEEYIAASKLPGFQTMSPEELRSDNAKLRAFYIVKELSK